MPKPRELSFSTFNGVEDNGGGKGHGVTCFSRSTLVQSEDPWISRFREKQVLKELDETFSICVAMKQRK